MRFYSYKAAEAGMTVDGYRVDAPVYSAGCCSRLMCWGVHTAEQRVPQLVCKPLCSRNVVAGSTPDRHSLWLALLLQ